MSSVHSAVAQRKPNTLVALAAPTVYSLALLQSTFAANGGVAQIGSNFVVGTSANIVSLLAAAATTPAPAQYQSLLDIGKTLVIQEDGTAAATVPFAEVKLTEVSYISSGVVVNAYVVTESSVVGAPVKVARA